MRCLLVELDLTIFFKFLLLNELEFTILFCAIFRGLVMVHYLISSEEGATHCIVEQSDVICDGTSVTIGDAVSYLYHRKTYEGVVVQIADDVNDLNKTLKDMLKAAREKKIAAGANVSTEIMNEKRSKKPPLKLKDDSDHHHTNKVKKPAKKHHVNDAEEKERKKKKNNEIRDAAAASEQSSNTEKDDDVEKKKDNATESNGNLEKDDSVGKNVVPEMTAANSDKKPDDSDKLEDDSNKNEYDNDGKSKEESFPSDDDDEDELDKDQQLFGKDHSEKMSHLCNGIYCKKFVLKMALHASTQPEHLARRLLEGVFKTENILDCTITGRSANAQGKARQAEKTTPLHPTAVAAIISFVKSTSVTKEWQVPSEQKLKAVIGVRLGEMKRETKRAALLAKLNAE